MAIDIARREFIPAFGGAAVAWPIAAGAQQSIRMRRMGLLVGYAENDSEAQAHIAALRETLQKLGWRRTTAFRSTSGGLLETSTRCTVTQRSSCASIRMSL